jgi:ATPase family associated with various cellular activities (AAA)
VSEEDFSPERFGAAYLRFMEWVHLQGRQEESSFAAILRDHFGADPSTFPITTETVAPYDRPNLQLALDAYLAEPGREHEVIGFGGAHQMLHLSLASVVGRESAYLHLAAGPVQRTLVELDEGLTVTCVTKGLYLISGGDGPLAVHVGQDERGYGNPDIELEVMAPEAEQGELFVARLRRLMDEHNVYRGRMIALRGSREGYGQQPMGVEFLARPATARENIVLPSGLLDTIELHTIEFARVRDVLAASGRHLRRGLLLHGAPGTGKTLTAGYLAARLADRTVLLLTGRGLGLIGPACAIARALQPSVVILEDIDLVAADREMVELGNTSLLFELLNEMDGIGEDADVIFLMTTNRPDLLEPALAARPGRVDQAVELPLPDDEGRARLLELFSQGLDVSLADGEVLVEATEGASPAFLRELVRKAALGAAVEGSEVVGDTHFQAALSALEEGGRLTRRILGADGADEADAPTGGWPAFADDEDDEDQEWE